MTSCTPIARHRLTAAGALLTALVFAGTACTGGQPPPAAAETSSSGPSVASTPTPSVTPTPTASYKPADATGRAQNVPVPVLPDAAKAETKEGLEAFARYWFALLSYGYETGDVARLAALTSPGCRSCERAKAVITGWHTDGRWLAGGRTQTPSVSTTFLVAPDGNYQVAIQASQSAISYFNSDGSLYRSDPKPDDTGNLMLAVYRDGSWYVNNIQPIVG
ncbi:DUF6318 family protein [Arthrobacter sp. B3I4]|uniref:DUF6318 family protein n=1 Tax=Arthrobacter sp. B3I4 TaxID=3042267 RepID=UPI002786674C|nr:DUF6318 family protein [Arthrobacter sp. B3I4]MDQ0754037.1 hypothetical protein [Arthrobacter sp. B3I4]